MCIIVYKPKNKKLPKKDILNNCFNNNNDGAGYMFSNNNKVIIKKGFDNFNKFYKSVLNDYKKYDLKNKNLVLHFRIGTSGGINQQKTHPFAISDNISLLNKIYLKSDYGLVHNGILYDYVENKFNLSDTQNFVKTFIYPLLKLANYDLKNHFIKKLITKELEHDKMIILDKKDNVYMFGDFIKDKDIYYSNSTYENYNIFYKKNINYTQNNSNVITDYSNIKSDEFYLSNIKYEYIKNNYEKIEDNKSIILDDDTIIDVYDGYFEYYTDKNKNIYEVSLNSNYYSLIGKGEVVQLIY